MCVCVCVCVRACVSTCPCVCMSRSFFSITGSSSQIFHDVSSHTSVISVGILCV